MAGVPLTAALRDEYQRLFKLLTGHFLDGDPRACPAKPPEA